MNSARLELTPSHHLTILPEIHILIFRGARATHRTQPQEREREAVMTDDGSQPPIEQLATAVHPWTGHTLVVWPAAACVARRGCNVVGVLCMLSHVWISGASFREETRNIGNIDTVELLIINPNGPYISGHSERGPVTHSSRDRYRWWITDRRLR